LKFVPSLSIPLSSLSLSFPLFSHFPMSSPPLPPPGSLPVLVISVPMGTGPDGLTPDQFVAMTHSQRYKLVNEHKENESFIALLGFWASQRDDVNQAMIQTRDECKRRADLSRVYLQKKQYCDAHPGDAAALIELSNLAAQIKAWMDE
jgi:hypothetical protein